MINLGLNDQEKYLYARTINKGDCYGLNGCLTHSEKEPLIEFYTGNMIFISRYYRSTLMGQEEILTFLNERPAALHGLCLCGDTGITATAKQVQQACNAQGHELRLLAFKALQGADND